ncbi:MAG: ATP-binding protein [Candidatus Cloacimonetes bacterium]|nr:ATP-binding protein [Candidatus Cloacimonadota bacterium]
MKEHVFVETQNVKRAKAEIAKLLARPKHEMVGLGMIYGDPGLGKSRLAKQIAYRKGYIYLRLDATETARSFAQKLWKALRYQLNVDTDAVSVESGSAPAGTTNTLMGACIRMLMDAPDSVIMIDEFDNALPNRELRESIRDIVDNTFATVILIGMRGVKEKMERINVHFFDRSNFFCEFQPLSLDDVKLIVTQVCDYELPPKLIEAAHRYSEAQFRKLIKTIVLYEHKIKNKQSMSLNKRELEEINNASGSK